jgi:hypothetical protein
MALYSVEFEDKRSRCGMQATGEHRQKLIQQMFEAMGLGTAVERQEFIKFVKEPVGTKANSSSECEQLFIRCENATVISKWSEHGQLA